jgi:hypothetical protein
MLSFFIKDSSGYILEFKSLKKGILFSKANYLKPSVTNVNLKDDYHTFTMGSSLPNRETSLKILLRCNASKNI